MEQLLYNRGYRLHCTYSTLNGSKLRCYIRFDFNTNSYAFAIEDTILAEDIQGKSDANAYFKNNLSHMVDTTSKVLEKRNHLYSVHYYAGPRGRDTVMLKNSDMSVEELTAWWNEMYKFAIINHGYRLHKIDEIY
jgi:hypothetical protein